MNAMFRFTAVLAAAAFLAAGCTDPTQDKKAATVNPAGAPAGTTEPAGTSEPGGEETPAPDQTAQAAAETYVFTEDSYIGFTGYKTILGVTGQHFGQFLEFDGTVKVPGEDLTKATIEVTLQTDSLTTDNTILTDVLKNESFFDVAQYPTASFKSTAIEAMEAPGEYKITGDFTIHGVTQNLSFDATMDLDGDTVTGAAEFLIQRKLWGIETDSYMGDTVIKEDALLNLDIVAEKAAAETAAAPIEGS